MRQTPWCVLALILAANGCTPSAEPMAGTNSPGPPDPAEKVVREVIALLLKVEPSAIPMDRPISEPPLKADELDLVEIVMELEDRQGIQISDAAIERYAGGPFGKGPVRITPNQLVSIVREAPRAPPTRGKK